MATPRTVRLPRAPVRGTEPGASDVVTPAPWVLNGCGVVLVLRDRTRSAGGRWSTVAFVDYEASDVGPYRELLHVPGIRRIAGATGPTVDRIWVTLHESAISGNANWGLSKTVAAIERTPLGEGRQAWEAGDEHGPLASLVHRPYGPLLPAVKPARLPRLLQARGATRFRTPVGLRGRMRLTRVEALTLDPARVHDLTGASVAAAIAIERGTLTFGVPEQVPLG